MPGMFRRPRRSVLSPLGLAAGAFRVVHTEEELNQAISQVAVSQATQGAVTFGFLTQRIIIASPIALAAPIKVPVEAFGLTIEGSTRGALLTAAVDMDALVYVYGYNTTLRGIYASNGQGTVESFVRLDPAAVTDGLAVNFNMIDCEDSGFTYSLYRPTAASGTLTDALIADCRCGGNIDIDVATDCIIRGNNMSGNDIIIRAGSDNVIMGNPMGGGDITTSAGSGGDTIVGNTNIGTLTANDEDVYDASHPLATAGDYNS